MIASSAAKGSSMRRMSGSFASARAIWMRCFIPPESSKGNFPPSASRPTSRRYLSDRSLRTRAPRRAIFGPNSTFSRAFIQGKRALLTSWKMTVLSVPGPVTGIVVEGDASRRSLLEAGDDVEEGGFAAPARSEEGEERPPLDSQGDVPQHLRDAPVGAVKILPHALQA